MSFLHGIGMLSYHYLSKWLVNMQYPNILFYFIYSTCITYDMINSKVYYCLCAVFFNINGLKFIALVNAKNIISIDFLVGSDNFKSGANLLTHFMFH